MNFPSTVHYSQLPGLGTNFCPKGILPLISGRLVSDVSRSILTECPVFPCAHLQHGWNVMYTATPDYQLVHFVVCNYAYQPEQPMVL